MKKDYIQQLEEQQSSLHNEIVTELKKLSELCDKITNSDHETEVFIHLHGERVKLQQYIQNLQAQRSIINRKIQSFNTKKS